MDDEFDSEIARAFEANGSLNARLEVLDTCMLAVMDVLAQDDRAALRLTGFLQLILDGRRTLNDHSETVGRLEAIVAGLRRRLEQRRGESGS